MIQIRPSGERGHAHHGWLESYHSFSFADYYDERFMGFRDLRVINQDRIAGGSGFPTHGHRDMEILSYVIDGALEHKDSLGTSSVIRPGEAQRMSAGTGIQHSEFNHYKDRSTQFLQIWLLPSQRGLAPSYEQKDFTEALAEHPVCLLVSPDGREGTVRVHQDILVYGAKWSAARAATIPIAQGRYAWVQVINGPVDVNGVTLHAGDGAALTGESRVDLKSSQGAEFLVFDLN